MVENLNRRKFLEVSALTSMGSLVASGLLPKVSQAQAAQERKYLFVICASGGGTLLDSFLPQSSGPAAYAQNSIATPTGSNISCVLPISDNSIQGAIPLGNGYSLATFLAKHMADVAVMSTEVSSVNHFVAAERAMTGDNTNGGITISEALAAIYGKSCVLPNVNMSTGGYGITGLNKSTPEIFHGVSISDPLMFGFSTHGYKGIAGALDVAQMARARSLRSQLEKASKFVNYAKTSQNVSAYMKARESLVVDLEKGDYINKTMINSSPELSAYGLTPSSAMPQILDKFPNIAKDPYEAQMGLAFLLAKYGLSTALTVAPSASPLITSDGSPNSPLAFDWAHVDHRGAQNAMWSYIIKSVDGLIDLLKAEDIDGDPAKGKMWSRSLIYIATEFGRDKVSSGGSGHHLNNGNVLISPLLKGNRIYGGIDPATALTYGFDPKTGTADPSRQMKEKDVYSALACALEIPYSNRQDFSGMLKKT